MVKVNAFFVNDSHDIERFLSDSRIVGLTDARLMQMDWDDGEGTALIVNDSVLSRLEEIAEEYGIKLV
ncbi:hypothetical protein [Mahella australiensis]|uniref:Putrescine--2-oxoglutarate aminotransferase n=1 Tax=Mahella australiensis (strain DSM 15567 / CIP 107919 / 50-1 BON) TaxID=697281 RepID=F3ZXE8_MAHA5|nr:hypothetical protein [Mahella australiensis]AEE97629.1 putrescine--2-oxoglutarate aminotransferase [Mahella australiensis 50-1 BON]